MQFRAPGRVNIVGEHTDYNDGFVLPTTTAAFTTVLAEARDDRTIRIESRSQSDVLEFSLDDTLPVETPVWSDYARGVAAEIEATGIRLRGANLRIDGDIPIGGGLSSSASFELAIGVSLLDLSDASMAAKELAQACQRAEVRFAGVNCGIMDQMAIAACERDRAMFLDCRTLDATSYRIPDSLRFLVVDSGVRHQLPQSGYNDRAAECREAVGILAARSNAITSLRDATIATLDANAAELGDTLLRRARHVITENQRVRDACDALQQGDQEKIGNLVSASHASLRDDFEISCTPVDDLVVIANSCDGTFGARQVGGGFGGCVIVVTSADAVTDVRARIIRDYSAILGMEPWTHVVSAADPAGRVQE
ncbi:MAG: galactokinase [Pseudomonadota bacterium]